MKQTLPIALTLVFAALIGQAYGQSPQVAGPPTARLHIVGLPDTGQDKCYDTQGLEVPCDLAFCPGQDGFYDTGCATGPGLRFFDQGDGTVYDVCTGLMWQKNTADVNGDSLSNAADTTSWCDALTYSEDLVFAGYDDWRLPNVRELESIVHYGRSDPAIAPVFGAESMPYWTSTTFVADPSLTWVVDFAAGVDFDYDGDHNYVRAVRVGP